MTYKDAIARKLVRLPNGEQATLTFVNRNGNRARAVECASGRHWEGRVDRLEVIV